MPCAASTMRMAPSQAASARETSYEKSTWPGRVDEVERVDLAVACAIEQPDRVRLDGDAALALQVHRVEDLVDRLLGVHRPGQRQQPVGQRRLAVIDVGDDREVTDERETHACQSSTVGHGAPAGQKAPARGPSAVERGVVGHDGAGLEGDAGADAGVGADLAPGRRSHSRGGRAPGPTVTPSHRTAPSTHASSPMRQPSPTTARGPTRRPRPDLDAGADSRGRRHPGVGGQARRRRDPRAVALLARRRQRRAHAPVQQVDLGLAVGGRAADVPPVRLPGPSRRRQCRRRSARERTRARSRPRRSAGIRSSSAASMR